MRYCIDDFSPCMSCLTKECGLVDGNECEKYGDFLKIKSKLETKDRETYVCFRYRNDYDITKVCCIQENKLYDDIPNEPDLVYFDMNNSDIENMINMLNELRK